MTSTIDIPLRFYDDHIARDLIAPTVVKRLARTVRIEVKIGSPEWDELLSDATHYATDDSYISDTYYRGISMSAKAAVRAMQAAASALVVCGDPRVEVQS